MTTFQARLACAGLAVFCLTGLATGQMPQISRTKSAENAKVYIISPQNGDTVTGPFTVQFGLKGMGVAPAGVNQPNTGHHHLLIDVDQSPAADTPLPNNEQVRHFGGGQTETELTLPPGQHTLQLVFGDFLHIPHDPMLVSEKITITVR